MAFGYKRIFAALDGASTQRAVMERAIALAEEEHAELTFGHVIDSVPYEASGVDFELLCNEGKIRIETDLADLLEKARNNADIPSVQLIVRAGRITDTLQKQLIEPTEPDLVICGARGLSNIKYAILGSISTFLVRSCECDVLIVK